jgi:16S rRNA processing protein RimM
MAEGNILMGVVGKPHGVRGLLHVHSFTADPADLAAYAPLMDERGRAWSLAWRGEGVAELRDATGKPVADRTQAEKLTNLRLYTTRDRLPATEDPDEYYLADLIGLQAIGPDGAPLGQVTTLHDYGAGASLEITHNGTTTFIPFTRAAVPVVDIPGGQITIHPPHEIEVREVRAGLEPNTTTAGATTAGATQKDEHAA